MQFPFPEISGPTCRSDPGQLAGDQVLFRLDGNLQTGEGHVGGQVGRVEGRQDGDEHPPGGEQQPGRVCSRSERQVLRQQTLNLIE